MKLPVWWPVAIASIPLAYLVFTCVDNPPLAEPWEVTAKLEHFQRSGYRMDAANGPYSRKLRMKEQVTVILPDGRSMSGDSVTGEEYCVEGRPVQAFVKIGRIIPRVIELDHIDCYSQRE